MNHRYYALAATCALFKHTESKLNTRFAAGSLRIRYVPVEGTMLIDPDTARNLELVGNMAYKKSMHSLFGCVETGGRFTYTMLNDVTQSTEPCIYSDGGPSPTG